MNAPSRVSVLIAAWLVLPATVATTAGVRPVTPKVALLTGGAAEDLKVLREVLEKTPGVKFKAEEIQYSDFGKEGGMFTSFFPLEITDRSKTDIGAIAKAVAEANTSKKDRTPSALYVILRYRPDSVKNEQFRAVLAKVKGVRPDRSWAGDANLWVSVDGSGQGKLGDITRARRSRHQVPRPDHRHRSTLKDAITRR